MTDIATLQILAQVSPAATTLTTLYVVPASTSAVASQFVVCNSNNYKTTFRISLAVAGAADNRKQYLFYDLPMDPHETVVIDSTVVMAAADVLRCYANSGDVAFQAFGTTVVAA